jgi:hypothetical protein
MATYIRVMTPLYKLYQSMKAHATWLHWTVDQCAKDRYLTAFNAFCRQILGGRSVGVAEATGLGAAQALGYG